MHQPINTTLITIAIITLLSGCISSQNMVKTRSLPDLSELAVNSQGNVEFRGGDFSCTTYTGMGTTYKEILKDFEKAKEWDLTDKPASLEKEINSYLACGLSVKYYYDKNSDSSKVTTCFKNPQYQYHIEYNCLTFVDYDRVINALNQAPGVIKELNNEQKAADSLK